MEDTKSDDQSSKMRGEAALSNNYSIRIQSSVNHKEIYADHTDISNPPCLIYVPGNSSEECKVLGDFGSKYAEIRPTKEHRHDTTNIKINRQQ